MNLFYNNLLKLSVLIVFLCNNVAFCQFGPPELIGSDLVLPNSVVAADLNGDGSLDAVVASFGEYSSGEFKKFGKLVWYPNDGLGNFGDEQVIVIPADGAVQVIAKDMDKDGDQDLIVGLLSDDIGPGESGTFVFLNLDGFGTFDQGTKISNKFSTFQTVDIDNDGDFDILWETSIGMHLSKNENGVFQYPNKVISLNSTNVQFDVGDIDGDGDKDIVIGTFKFASDFQLAWYENLDGVDQFSETPNILTTQNFVGTIKLVDIDNDGDQDLVAAAYGTHSSLALFENDGVGLINVPNVIQMTTLGSPTNLHCGDINLDGNLDIIIPYSNNYKIAWIPQSNEKGVFDDYIIVNPTQDGLTLRSGYQDDFDGDGDLDYICAAGNSLYLYTNYILNAHANLSGITYWDKNENGEFDQDELGLENQIVNLEPQNLQTWTSGIGTFEYLSLIPGSYNLESYPSVNWEPTSSSSFPFWLLDSTNITHNFGVKPIKQVVELSTGIGSAPTRCGFIVPFWIEYTNSGTEIIEGSVSFKLDSLVTFVKAIPMPESISGNTLSWSFDELQPTYQKRIKLELEMPNSDFLGENVSFQSTIDFQNQSGTLSSSDIENYSSIIACSYDPNDKLTEPDLDGENYTLIGDTLTYTIRFQNTGTDTAFTVRIEDQLSTYLIKKTLKVIAASHPYVLQRTKNDKLIFNFRDILIPDSTTNEIASHGFVKFQIISRSYAIPDSTIVLNTAEIYFDFNEPIVTNTVQNILAHAFPFEASVQHVSCFDGNDGNIQLSSSFFETDQFSYQWSNGEVTDFISNLTEGTYIVNAFNDDKNIVYIDTIVIIQPETLTLSGSQTPATVGQKNGTATVVPMGGTAPYTYIWNTIPVQTTNTAINLNSGEYSVEVTDANGCLNLITIIVDETVSNKKVQEELINLTILPNPSNDQFKVIFDLKKTEEWTIKIFNSIGTIVESKVGFDSKGELNFGGFSPGIYVLTFSSQNQFKTSKIIIQ